MGLEELSDENLVLFHREELARARGNQYLKPSLICDLIELFRFNIDEFLLSYILKLDPNDSFECNKPYLTSIEMKNYILELSKTFDKTLEHQRMKKFGKRAKLRTIIKEEPIKLAQYLRGEKTEYTPYTLKLP